MKKPLGIAVEAGGEEGPKSWQTSHLPRLREYEVKAVLDLMRGWYQNEDFSFAGECNWPVLWEYMDRNGLGGMLGSAALDSLCEVPGPIGQMAEHRYFSTQLHHQQALECCDDLARCASSSDINLTVLKGPALVLQGYVDTGVRPYSDIDVFVEKMEDVDCLRKKLGGLLSKASGDQHLLQRLGESECAGFMHKGWELEFRYPLDPPGEPMFEILSTHGRQLFRPGPQRDDILLPDPSLHLVFLLQHMAVHHLFSRFFWFLDLAVLVRQWRSAIDFDFVSAELQRLGLANCGAAASDFCRRHIDDNFPMLCGYKKSWNRKVLADFVRPENIASGKYGIYHRGLLSKIYAYLVGVVSFYFVADPGGRRFGFGCEWTLNRFRNSFGVKKPIPWVDFLLRPVISLCLLPLAFTLGLFTGGEVSENEK